ncbi:hypothetical protein Droror1_Dr00009495 [Drosera rotundifolia]
MPPPSIASHHRNNHHNHLHHHHQHHHLRSHFINSLTSNFFCPKLPPRLAPPLPSSPPAVADHVPDDWPTPHKLPEFPVRITGNIWALKDGGPAFYGETFVLTDPKTKLWVATRDEFRLPYLPHRAAELVNKVLRVILKSDDHPVYHFFTDQSHAESYAKRPNPPDAVVLSYPLILAYMYFKEHSGRYQFTPSKKQLKAADNILKKLPTGEANKRVDGAPVFYARNLECVVASRHSIKRYIPYFFNKEEMDDVVELLADRYFHKLIETRHSERKLAIEESEDDMWELPPEIDELQDEMGVPSVSFYTALKVAEMELMHAVDNLLLGNRWLRKATGIQPKVLYAVDSFEKRTAGSECEKNNDHQSNLGLMYTMFIGDRELRGMAAKMTREQLKEKWGPDELMQPIFLANPELNYYAHGARWKKLL